MMLTLSNFTPVFVALAVQLRQTDADELAIRAYYDALKDLEFEFVAMAAKSLAASAEWFPRTSQWRAAAARVERERVAEQRAYMKKLRSPLCAVCSDTGWAPDEDDRVHPCNCRSERRLELLGQRPWPRLESGAVTETSDGPSTPAETAAFMASLRERGLTPQIRVMRGSLQSRLARLEAAARAVAHAEPDAPPAEPDTPHERAT
jgi:hypothetical protein